LQTPALLRARPEIAAGIVARRCRSHVVYGIIVDDEFQVIGVLHMAMDPSLHLDVGDED
jgi:hypothetical protein